MSIETYFLDVARRNKLRWSVNKGIHLLGDDVGVGADRAGKKFGFLEERQADFLEIVDGEDAAGGLLDPVS